MKSKKIVLVKLGGSIITNKSKPYSVKKGVVAKLVKQIARVYREGKYRLLIGHGSGSFAHFPADKYRTIDGVVNNKSVYGAALVEDAASRLNRIVIEELLKQGVSAVSAMPSSFMLAGGKQDKKIFLSSMIQMLDLGMVPVVYGDLIFDNKIGFTIWSTEQILNFLAKELLKTDYKVNRVIHCANADGFLVNGNVVEKINKFDFKALKKYVGITEGYDVTGGMLHKLEEAMNLADCGIDSYIIGGNHGDNLYRTMIGGKFIGTRVTR